MSPSLVILAALLTVPCDAIRHRKLSRKASAEAGSASAAWATHATKERGPCADHMNSVGYWPRPITFPLLCTGHSTDLILTVTTNWGWQQNVTIWWDGQDQGTTKLDNPGTIRLTLGAVPKGVHYVGVFGGNMKGAIDLSEVKVVGLGTPCSFDNTPYVSRDATSYTYGGFDALNRLFGESVDFPLFKKEQLYFVSETIGKMDDGSIDAGVVGEGMWEWMYQYSQQQAPGDAWNRRMMYEESEIKPWPEVELGNMPRHAGQKMIVQEPCNTLSNLAYHQAAVWISCKGYPLNRDELASLLAAFNALAAGSAFMHASGTSTGGMADTFSMDWLMLQIYQSLVSQILSDAGDRLTPVEQSAILEFGSSIGRATDVAKNMTRLTGQKYDHASWNGTMRAMQAAIPAYEMPIVGLISFVMWAIQGKIGGGTDQILQSVLDALMDVFGIPDADFFSNVYTPAVRKALGFSTLCSEALAPVIEYTLKFIVTFVEALVFQEEKVPVPDAIRDVVAFLDNLGLTSTLLSDMSDTWDMYNGFNCTARSDHAIWHEKAAHGLVHMLNVAEWFRTGVGC